MATTASDHIRPCNIGQSEAHNRRSAEYMAHINAKAVYVRTDLTRANESWEAPELDGLSLQDYQERLARMVKEKTGRAMQTKERERKDKKTGKVVKVAGSSPIREGVVLIKEDTTMDDLRRYARLCHERWGITPLQIFIHRDEGHYGNADGKERGAWLPNLHAHIVWDWMSHDTGKSCKLGREDMSEMQSLLAATLGMERGKSKTETGHEHLERNDFILAKQKREMAEAERRSAELETEIADKEERARQADKENTEGIKSGIANLLGKGKYAAIEQRNRELEESVSKAKAQLQAQFKEAVERETAKRTKPIADKLTAAQVETERLRVRYNGLVGNYNEAVRARKEVAEEYTNRLRWRDDVLTLIARMLYKTQEVFRKAIDAIIDFARAACHVRSSQRQDIFTSEQAASVKTAIDAYAATDRERVPVGNWLVNFAADNASLSDQEYSRASNEVRDVAEGRYEWRISNAGCLGR